MTPQNWETFREKSEVWSVSRFLAPSRLTWTGFAGTLQRSVHGCGCVAVKGITAKGRVPYSPLPFGVFPWCY